MQFGAQIKCEDCGAFGTYMDPNMPIDPTKRHICRVEACADRHVSIGGCCSKFVCYDKCTYTCATCNCDMVVDAWPTEHCYSWIRCASCTSITNVKVKWFGPSVIEACNTWCGCDMTSKSEVLDAEH